MGGWWWEKVEVGWQFFGGGGLIFILFVCLYFVYIFLVCCE